MQMHIDLSNGECFYQKAYLTEIEITQRLHCIFVLLN